MTGFTPAQEFLSEIKEINNLIADILSFPRNDHWHWPSLYLLYVDVDRLAMTLMRAEHFCNNPFWAIDSTMPVERVVESGNALFGELGKRQKAVARWIYPLLRRTKQSEENKVLYTHIEAHFHPKSGWNQQFFAEYDAGVLTADGKTLKRTVLPVFAVPADKSRDYIDHISASCMLRHQSFDLSASAQQVALAHAVRSAASALGKISDDMQSYLLAHCKLKDLMHPCSA